MSELYRGYYQSEIGLVEIIGTEEVLTSVRFVEEAVPTSTKLPSLIENCREQLAEYFRGERTEFDLKYELRGTPFQREVWHYLTTIPYGQTVSYRDIAQTLGNMGAVRAVGHANGQNRVWIIVPCHRVIGSDGKLTGYAGGLWRKEWLLKHEKALAERTPER